MKIVATTLGETLGDFISMTLNLGYTVGIAITLAFFLVALFTQLTVKNYIPAIYWLVIIGTTTLGTEISDFIDRTLHLGYTLGKRILLLDGHSLLKQFGHCIWRFSGRPLRIELPARCFRDWRGYTSCYVIALPHQNQSHHLVLDCIYFHPPIWGNIWRLSDKTNR